MKAPCPHPDFVAGVEVNRLTDSGRFHMDVQVACKACLEPFRFVGLPLGIDLDGPAMSVDGLRGRFAIAPASQSETERRKLGPAARGFTVVRGEDV